MRVLLIALLLTGTAYADEPRLRTSGSGLAQLTFPSDVLRSPQVQKRLQSGLTASFVIEIDGKRAAVLGIRRDLWEERWLVEISDARGRTRRADERDIALVWRELAIALPAPQGGRARVVLTVYPFSDLESADTRTWLSQSTAVDPQSPPSAAIDAMIRTAIRARPVHRRQWTVRTERIP